MTRFSDALMREIRLEYTFADFDRDDLVRLLIELRELRADLAIFAKDAERDLLAKADVKRWVVDDLGEVTVRRSNKRTEWDNDGLTAVVVARALDERILDESTGEYESEASAVSRVLSECSRPSWRLTPLRARGIDESEFCHVEEGAWSVELPPRRDV